MANPFRIPAGVNNVQFSTTYDGAKSSHPLFNWPENDPFRLAKNFNDFMHYRTADWTATVVGTGTAGIISGAGGIAQLNTSATLADSVEIQQTTASVAYQGLGKQFWYTARIIPEDATNPLIIVGHQNINTAPATATDGIWFEKAAASTSVDLKFSKASTVTTISGVATMADATAIVLSFYFDGKDTFSYYVNNVKTGTTSTITNIPTVDITPTFFIENGIAATKYLNIDYYLGATEISR